MAPIVLLIDDPGASRGAVIAAIRSRMKLPVAEIQRRLETASPVVAEELFPRGGDSASRLMALVNDLDRLGVRYEMYEVPPPQQFDRRNASRFFKVDAETLARLIQSHDEIHREQQDLAFLEAQDAEDEDDED